MPLRLADWLAARLMVGVGNFLTHTNSAWLARLWTLLARQEHKFSKKK